MQLLAPGAHQGEVRTISRNKDLCRYAPVPEDPSQEEEEGESEAEHNEGLPYPWSYLESFMYSSGACPRRQTTWRNTLSAVALLAAAVAVWVWVDKGVDLLRFRTYGPHGDGRLQALNDDSIPNVCPGTIWVPGHGLVSLVNAYWNVPGERAGFVEVFNGSVVPHMTGRSYFGSACTSGAGYAHTDYAAVQLLGRRLRFTVDLSGAGCGCNVALYLTSLHQNDMASACSDFYCDANNVCGVSCSEIDIMEANTRAIYSTLHVPGDAAGLGAGYGRYHKDWNATVYGPGARCIDTLAPFEVTTFFPVDAAGVLEAMEVTLSQPGKPCPLSVRLAGYKPKGQDGMAELSLALQAGMTPIISYWGIGNTMEWLDGAGPDGLGPCATEDPAVCSETVTLTDFSVE
mmetsp:Transcript_10431/g.29473  ORF Transcript_10431/g.29473 Transcript_10431/m.29473 type:complete len:401 (-) Transcript_10431:62-1264(-)